MGAHRTTIKRKKPLTHINTAGIKRREAIKLLHIGLKSTQNPPGIPLSVYQKASSKGQDIQHGGDSSKILVQWLKNSPSKGIRVLEIGCLEVDNAIAKYVNSQNGSIRHIDLKSRDPRIEEQDFMSLPVPTEVYTSESRLMNRNTIRYHYR
jgi:25S rRNA (adenine2142-N1)-methyltransferase